MNKELSFMLLAFCIFMPVNMQSQRIEKDNVIYLLEEEKAFIVGFHTNASKAIIESSITYKKRYYIVAGVKLDSKQAPCYDGKTTKIKEMVFAEGVKEIFDKIALNMTMLEKVVLPNTATTIGQSAFSGCKSLKEVGIPKSLVSIGEQAFFGCASLNSFEIPDSISTIGKEAFKNCSSLQEISIPMKLRRIGTGVFWGCSALAKANIQSPINRLPACFFRDCKSLKSLIIRPYIKSIDWEAFRGCTSLKAMNVPKSVTSIGINAFYGCTSLQRVKFPDGLTEIARGAFKGCSSLKSITLPKGLKTINEITFEDCKSLVSINIRDSVIAIGREAFSGCSSLEEIVVPPTVTKIGQGAFKSCSSLSTVILKCNSIDKIPDKCFSGCKSLSSIVIPNSVKSFGKETFYKCTNLADVILPDSAKYLTDKEATIISQPSYYKSLPFNGIFTDRGNFYGCKNLTNIKCHNGSTPDSIIKYIPSDCIFTLNGGKSENPEFDKPLLASVANYTGKKKVEATKMRNFKYVIKSDVDMSIPVTNESNASTFAIIIGNENYDLVPYVKYAENDARIFAEYCQKVLGLPEKNINVIYDATYVKMVDTIHLLDSISNTKNGQINVLFYYSGHGVPDERTRNSFLLPIDEDGSSTDDCYAVSKLYKDLAEIRAKRTLVFLDACFSGSQRDGGVLQVSARGVAIKAKESKPTGSMVVFSAATGEETAYPFEGRSHGMFTYFLLKKLKESQGNVTLGELADFIKKNVGKTSVLENKKSQTPTISPSEGIASIWEEMRL